MIQPVNYQQVPQSYQPQANYQTQPYWQAPIQNNAVKIDIINPQAGMAQPYQSMYQMPQTSMYAPGAQYPQYVPQAQCPVCPVCPAVPQAEIPQPQVQPVAQTAPAPAPTAPQQAQPTQAPTVEQPKPTPKFDLGQTVAKLNSNNLEEQLATIINIAEQSQLNTPDAIALLDTQVMSALAGIIKKDSTQLQGPTPEQLALRKKALSNGTLTPEEKAKANVITPMELAEKNKLCALYTTAMLQKKLNTEVAKAQAGKQLALQELPLINDVIQTAKVNPNPSVRAAALAALSHIANKDNKIALETMFKASQSDADPTVNKVATEALARLAQAQ